MQVVLGCSIISSINFTHQPRSTFVVLYGLLVVEHGKDKEWAGDAEGHDPDNGDLRCRESSALGAAVAQREAERQVAIN
jgi:hypothetical protein